VPDELFDKPTIEASFAAVAAHLEAQGAEPGVLIVVGGSFMALHGLRKATRDVDTISRITKAIRAAVDAISRTRGFEPDWLNDRAAAFAPIGLDEADCGVIYEHARLLVLVPPHDYVFLMKLYAGRAPDYDDMVALWPCCTFLSAEAAAARYHEAYPHAAGDPHLGEYVAQIAAEAGLESRGEGHASEQ